MIVKELKGLCNLLKCDFVLTAGGIVGGEGDSISEATWQIIEKEVSVILEIMRVKAFEYTPYSIQEEEFVE